jgi:hypothetical protein
MTQYQQPEIEVPIELMMLPADLLAIVLRAMVKLPAHLHPVFLQLMQEQIRARRCDVIEAVDRAQRHLCHAET